MREATFLSHILIMHIHYYGDGAFISNANSEIYINEEELEYSERIIAISNKINNKDIVRKRLENENVSFSKAKKQTIDYLFISSFSNNGILEVNRSGKKGNYYPERIILYITNKCAHRCIHCFRDSSFSGNEMSPNKLVSLLKELCPYVPYIEMSGGEPLLYSRFSEISIEAKKFYFSSIVTSLFCSPKNLDSLKLYNDVQVSMYGYDEQTQDGFTGVDGSFRQVCENIKRIVAIGCKVRICFMNISIETLEKDIELALSLGVYDIVFGKIDPIGRAEGNDLVSFQTVDDAELHRLRCKYNGKISLETDDGCYNKFRNGVCGAGYCKLDIDEFGNVYPCLFGNSGKIGNLFEPKAEFFKQKYLFYSKPTSYKCDALKKNIDYMKEVKINGI